MGTKIWGVLLGRSGLGSSVITAEAQVAAMAQVQALAWELPRATGMAKKNQNKTNKKPHQNLGFYLR